ncbi:hypothetical protein GCM10027440_28280 [Nocardiopsis coralliicola]
MLSNFRAGENSRGRHSDVHRATPSPEITGPGTVCAQGGPAPSADFRGVSPRPQRIPPNGSGIATGSRTEDGAELWRSGRPVPAPHLLEIRPFGPCGNPSGPAGSRRCDAQR